MKQREAKKLDPLFIFSSGVALFTLTACGSDSVQNTLNQERDRQRVSTATLAKDYQGVVGAYLTDEKTDTSDYSVLAKIGLTYVQRDGYLVPQPSLSGSFRIVDKQYAKSAKLLQGCKSLENSPSCGYLFSFTGGIYDSASRMMVLHIQGYGVSGADVSCKKSGAETLQCRWDPASGGAGGFDFVITRTE